MTETQTPTQDDLAAGRELDARVAKMMGWTVDVVIGPDGPFEEWRDPQGWRYGPDPKPYSSDIAAAWQIVDYMDSLGWKVQVRSDSQLEGYEARGPWVCVFASRDGAPWAAADTAPLAICRAAVAALSPSPPG